MIDVHEKYMSLEVYSTNKLWFSYNGLRMKVYFHPSLKSVHDIQQEVENLHSDVRSLANELINDCNWSLDIQEPRESVDFTWYNQDSY